MSHHEEWGGVETVHQDPHFLVDRQVERTAYPPHTLLAQPSFGGPEQRRESFLAVFGVQHAEKPGGIAIALEMQVVDLGTDPSDRLARAPGRPCLPSGVLEVWVATGRQVQAALKGQRLDP